MEALPVLVLVLGWKKKTACPVCMHSFHPSTLLDVACLSADLTEIPAAAAAVSRKSSCKLLPCLIPSVHSCFARYSFKKQNQFSSRVLQPVCRSDPSQEVVIHSFSCDCWVNEPTVCGDRSPLSKGFYRPPSWGEEPLLQALVLERYKRKKSRDEGQVTIKTRTTIDHERKIIRGRGEDSLQVVCFFEGEKAHKLIFLYLSMCQC